MRTGVAACCLLVAALFGVVGVGRSPEAWAVTDPTALVGEGGSFVSPVVNLLLNVDSGLAPLNPQYSDSNLDNAVTDFTGSSPGQFSNDFLVSERPLTSTEKQTATANGRSFAYVPFAATPVAIADFAVCQPSDLTQDVVTSSTFCQNVPLTPALVGGLLTSGLTTPSVEPNTNLPTSLLAWNDSRLTQAGGKPIPDGDGIGLASTLSPSAENFALMSLLDSDPTAKELLDNALANPVNAANTTTDAPSEVWPFHGVHAYIGGDEGLLGKELTIEATTNAPGFIDSWGALGGIDGNAHDVFPVSAVWTGAPEGTPWNVPTAAIQNADGQFVGPTLAAATAAEGGSGVTLDPTTNLVTFHPDVSDSAAYNNYLMVESYLVVPITSLASDKAIKLAQFIRFVLGPTGQSDIKVLGAAPATPAEVTAGLKVASEMDAEAVATSSASSSTSTTTTPGGTTTMTGSSASTGSNGSSVGIGSSDAASGTDTGTSYQGSGSTLAFTGLDLWPLLVVGGVLIVVAEPFRRVLRRRRRTS